MMIKQSARRTFREGDRGRKSLYWFADQSLRNTSYSRNRAQNVFRKLLAKSWGEHRHQHNKIFSLRKKSMSKYFDKNVEKVINLFGRLSLRSSLTRNLETEIMLSYMKMTTPLWIAEKFVKLSMIIFQVLPLILVSPMSIFCQRSYCCLSKSHEFVKDSRFLRR